MGFLSNLFNLFNHDNTNDHDNRDYGSRPQVSEQNPHAYWKAYIYPSADKVTHRQYAGFTNSLFNKDLGSADMDSTSGTIIFYDKEKKHYVARDCIIVNSQITDVAMASNAVSEAMRENNIHEGYIDFSNGMRYQNDGENEQLNKVVGNAQPDRSVYMSFYIYARNRNVVCEAIEDTLSQFVEHVPCTLEKLNRNGYRLVFNKDILASIGFNNREMEDVVKNIKKNLNEVLKNNQDWRRDMASILQPKPVHIINPMPGDSRETVERMAQQYITGSGNYEPLYASWDNNKMAIYSRHDLEIYNNFIQHGILDPFYEPCSNFQFTDDFIEYDKNRFEWTDDKQQMAYLKPKKEILDEDLYLDDEYSRNAYETNRSIAGDNQNIPAFLRNQNHARLVSLQQQRINSRPVVEDRNRNAQGHIQNTQNLSVMH